MPVHILHDVSLKAFTTTKTDKEKGIVRIPCDQPELMNMQSFEENL